MLKFEGGNVIEIDREAEKVSIPPTATRICEVACFLCSITSLDLENTNVIIIEKHAFANCCNLKEVRFPSCLEEICEGAFKNCTDLLLISFPPDSKLVKIGNSAFKYCSELKYFQFPSHLEFIGKSSFTGYCSQIIDLRGTKVRHFSHVIYSATTFFLPSTMAQKDIIKISENYECCIEVDESHPVVRRDSCGYFFANGTIFHGNSESRRVLIRRGVERIAKNCFNESIIVSVTIPSSVTEISDCAFYKCESLRHIRITKDSRLRVIGKCSFTFCSSIKDIHFPKSLKIIKEGAFSWCFSLERAVFPHDSQLERIEWAFEETAIKRLSLPPSVREIVDVSYRMLKLESMFVSNEYYQSNEEGSAIFSKDGSELVCVIKTLEHFSIPDSVRVIKKRAFDGSFIPSLIIPPSVEIIEEKVFNDCNWEIIEFKEGSRLNSLAFDAFGKLDDLIINNENFVKMENGVVMSTNPVGIVFVPRSLTELEIPPGVEVIYSNAFYESKIKRLKFPKSLKKICSDAFCASSLESIVFDEGTELEFIGYYAFFDSSVKSLKLPNIKGDLDEYFSWFSDVIEFPPNLYIRNKELDICAEKIICPLSSLSAITGFDFSGNHPKLVILNE